MKIKTPKIFVPYGPVGSPEAQLWMDFAAVDEAEVRLEFRDWLDRNCIQGNTPTVFYLDKETLEEQGYYILPVIQDEVSDDVIALLAKPKMYAIAAPYEPGRKMTMFERYLPSYTDLGRLIIVKAGDNDCDHDFGLESWETYFRKFSGQLVVDLYGPDAKTGEGEYCDTVTCSRCKAMHAYPQIG